MTLTAAAARRIARRRVTIGRGIEYRAADRVQSFVVF
jgi:hypothetical protein